MVGSKVLLIEDTQELVSVILRGIEGEGVEMSVAADGDTGLAMVLKHHFDLVILDIMLPGINGIQLCREIRKRNSSIAILMLTALGSTENIVTGLDSGADDYMVKPFKLVELIARMRTLIRRSRYNHISSDTITLGGIEVNTVSKTALRDGQQISLTATEYRLLEYLLKNQNKVLSRIQILENVWDIDFNMGTNVVDVYINYLRKKIDNSPVGKIIHTVFGMGYIVKLEMPNENPN
ncbi:MULTISPECIES: response regulator transcription factor [Pedobacter]|uniref:response regulator transcription factor n=1 Tax=Pedobacter TaxID=84567 RepID=UPI00210ACFAB|nr:MULTISPECIES: response regulator transcription factor [unclassified Pedobacter]